MYESEESNQSLPCAIGIKNVSKELAIKITDDSIMLLKNRQRAKPSDFQVGDKINVYGFMDKDNYGIEALILRKIASAPTPPPISKPSIRVISPNGGEKITKDNIQIIKWNSSPDIKYVDIQLERYEGCGSQYCFPNTILNVATKVLNTGSFQWKVNVSPGSYKVIVKDSDGLTFDKSDDFFDVVLLKLISPNGGELWQEGIVQQIKWESSSEINNVDIKLLVPYMNTWSEVDIAKNLPNTGSYSWKVGYDINGKVIAGHPSYKILVSNIYGGQGGDESDAPFSIVKSSSSLKPRIISPNGGEVWHTGSTYEIKWEGGPSVIDGISLLDYSRPEGAVGSMPSERGFTPYPIASRIPNTGSYKWTVPDNIPRGSAYKIYIASYALEEGAPRPSLQDDQSDGFFSIVKTTSLPSIQSEVKVISPNGGEVWPLGSEQEIRWSAPGNQTVSIYLKKYIACFYQKPKCLMPEPMPYVVAEKVASTGVYKWKVGDVKDTRTMDAGQYLIEIVGDQTNQSDESDAPFSIVSIVSR
jgi:hypothetical protein